MSIEASPGAPGSAGAAVPLRPEDPRHLGPYRLLGVLGSGGMGTVYLGRTPEGEKVAVKVVRLDLTGEQEFRERFAREVDAARRVAGSHTAGLVYADPHARQPWMATSFVLGPSLREAIGESGPLDVPTLRALGLGLAEGLTTIHGAGLVHRDLKPGNVLLTTGGPRIIDFGIARALEATALTSVSQVLGTASYMSPEQVRGHEAGTASDVFSFGCLLAYAATGSSPFGGGPAESVAYRVVHTEPDLDGVPSELKLLIRDCLAKDPAARPTPQQIVERITRRTARPVTWQTTPAMNTMIAARAKAVRALEARSEAEETEELSPYTGGERIDPAGGRSRGRGVAALKVVAAGLAGVLLPVGAWTLYDRLANPPSAGAVAPDGWYTMEGEHLGADPRPDQFVEIEITTATPGEQVLVGYAATVVRDDPGVSSSPAPSGGGAARGDTVQVGNEEGFLVETPWRGRIPVDDSVLAVGATGSGAEGEISCTISVGAEQVVSATAPSTSSCVTPFEGRHALGAGLREIGASSGPSAGDAASTAASQKSVPSGESNEG
ncbi:serine/threonine-protein kinase [Myceligenerans pegani]|uniref:Serine/threonine protein kinase n=1 Tax=Myceligenerans pegani TaxID=2776917 RepID=A0ABR9MV40_9MICO|nr:serine/threonine-protein kinase [Myceligenerans sp. TRM 65318]MBE1874990.1 serine/threonine protein kinase [Myceligenerans sp. TRM 65318]MBE3017261.1 serine/threonine protein kinase [Myceligenerans sp. TRM 65318]